MKPGHVPVMGLPASVASSVLLKPYLAGAPVDVEVFFLSGRCSGMLECTLFDEEILTLYERKVYQWLRKSGTSSIS